MAVTRRDPGSGVSLEFGGHAPAWFDHADERAADAFATLGERVRRIDAVRALCEQAIDRCEGHYARGGPVSGVLDGAEAHARYVLCLLDGEAGG